MTNQEKIQALSTNKLAELLDCPRCLDKDWKCPYSWHTVSDCRTCIRKWLKQEVTNEWM